MTTGAQLFSVEEALKDYLGGKVGRNAIYEAMRSGALKHIRFGRRILLSATAIDAWLRDLEHKSAS